MYAVPYLCVPTVAATRPASAAALALTLAARRDWWRPLVDYRAEVRWAHLVERDRDREVWLLSWLPGQGTALHDHGFASGAFAVADGALVEHVVTLRDDRAPVEVTHRLAPGRSRVFGPHYIHQVTNVSTEPAVSVHVYRPGRGVMHSYHSDPDRLRERV